MKAYKNIKFQQPHAQASYYCSLLLEHQSWPWNDELEVIPHLEPNDLAEFLPHLLSKCFVESYISGQIIISHMRFLGYIFTIAIPTFQEILNQMKQSR